MAAIVLGLFLLILQMTGMSDAVSRFQYNPFNVRNIRGRFGVNCDYKYRPFGCKDDAPNSALDSEMEKFYIRKYQKFPNYFRYNWNAKTTPRVTARLNENLDNDTLYVSPKTSFMSTQQDNGSNRHIIKAHMLFNHIQRKSSNSEYPTQSDSHLKPTSTPKSSPVAVNFVEHLDITDQKILIDSTENQNITSTQILENSSNDDAIDLSEKIKDIETSSEFIINTFAKDKLVQSTDKIKDNNGSALSKNDTLSILSADNSTNNEREGSTQNGKTETPSESTEDISTKNELEKFTDKNEKEDGSVSPKYSSVISYSTSPEAKRTSTSMFSSSKISSSQTVLFSNEDSLKEETTIPQDSFTVITEETTIPQESFSVITKETTIPQESFSVITKETTIPQDSFSIITEETTPTDDKSKSLVTILSTNIQESKLEPTISPGPSSSTSNEDIVSKTKSLSSEAVHTSNTQHLETETITSQSSTTMPNDDITFQSKLSSMETKPTTAKNLDDESTTTKLESSSKVSLTSLTDKVTSESIKEISSTKSSSKTQITSEAIMEDHIIEIPSIRTARIAITSIFLVIGLIGIVAISIYIFRLKRKTVHYDQLLLLS